MGECGCGKTQLIRYTCAYWGKKLFVLDVHGGTTIEDIEEIFEDVENYFKEHAVLIQDSRLGIDEPDVIIFFDEINTSTHVGLIAEIIAGHSYRGKKLSEKLVILGALNPYRLRSHAHDKTVAGAGPGAGAASATANALVFAGAGDRETTTGCFDILSLPSIIRLIKTMNRQTQFRVDVRGSWQQIWCTKSIRCQILCCATYLTSGHCNRAQSCCTSQRSCTSS